MDIGFEAVSTFCDLDVLLYFSEWVFFIQVVVSQLYRSMVGIGDYDQNSAKDVPMICSTTSLSVQAFDAICLAELPCHRTHLNNPHTQTHHIVRLLLRFEVYLAG